MLIESLNLSGSLNVYGHTATRYNKCHILNIPALKTNISYEFICKEDSRGHHYVSRCLHDKLPVSAEGQVCIIVFVIVIIIVVLLLGT